MLKVCECRVELYLGLKICFLIVVKLLKDSTRVMSINDWVRICFWHTFVSWYWFRRTWAIRLHQCNSSLWSSWLQYFDGPTVSFPGVRKRYFCGTHNEVIEHTLLISRIHHSSVIWLLFTYLTNNVYTWKKSWENRILPMTSMPVCLFLRW